MPPEVVFLTAGIINTFPFSALKKENEKVVHIVLRAPGLISGS